MYHKPTPGAIAEVIGGAIAEIMAEVIVLLTLKVAVLVDDQGPFLGLSLEGGWPSGNQRLSQTPRGVRRITH